MSIIFRDENFGKIKERERDDRNILRREVERSHIHFVFLGKEG